MKASELRIGNYVLKYDEERIVTTYHLEEMEALKDTHDYKPIPLTEEWLLKFGFESRKSGWYKIKEFFTVRLNSFELIIHIISKQGSYTIARVRSVHQLQNLYFAVTGEELTIK